MYQSMSCFLTLCGVLNGLREASALRWRIVFSSGGAGEVISLTVSDFCRRDLVLLSAVTVCSGAMDGHLDNEFVVM
jgi:hypothetical protein